MGLGSFFNKIDAPRAHLPVDLQNQPRKMMVVRWVASVVLERGGEDGFWARESPQSNKEEVGSVLGVAVYGGERRWWPVFGWPAVEKERRGSG